jgi:aarF domain-containing kinase
VFKSDLGMMPDEVFAEFSEQPLASASIAQVHRARLKPGVDGEGRIVAVKVQKPAIKKQMELDLFSYR